MFGVSSSTMFVCYRIRHPRLQQKPLLFACLAFHFRPTSPSAHHFAKLVMLFLRQRIIIIINANTFTSLPTFRLRC